jgi:glycosyl transferase family 10 (putative fucosyltransferase)
MTGPAIGFVPHELKLGPRFGSVPLSELIWPLGCPERLIGRKVRNLSPTDHIILFPRTATHFTVLRGTRAQVSLVLGEPAVIHAKHHALLRVTYRRFYKILTFNSDLLRRLPNAILFPYGTTWVPEWRDLPMSKTGMCSLIASEKRDSTGHKMRHSIVDWVRATGQDVEIMGRGYTPFERKSDGLAPYRYSVVIENVQEKNYFSEKLIDSILCNTVPIYWGCPNLSEFIATDGLILCNTREDLQLAIENMSAADFESRLPNIQALQPQVQQYCDIQVRAAKVIRDSLAQ